MATLTAAEARHLKLASLLLDDPKAARSPLEVARWMGALQGQDLASVQWSFGVRSLGTTVAEVDAAFERGEVLRTWPMRGTVHAIPSEDARWMLTTCGLRALQGVEKRWERLGLTEATVKAAPGVLADALAGGKRLTRAECTQVLVDAGLHTASGHGYHLLWYSSQVGVTCVGPNEGKEQTFVLLDEWAPDQRELEGDAALAVLADRFVRGRGPVTRQDLAGWGGITQGDAKRGIAAAGEAITEVEVDGTAMLVATELLDRAGEVEAAHEPKRAWLLPGFDELVLGIKDRALILDPERFERVVPGSNGMFRATVVVDGCVVGTWQRTARKASVRIDIELFEKVTKTVRASIERAAGDYGTFVGSKAAPEITGP